MNDISTQIIDNTGNKLNKFNKLKPFKPINLVSYLNNKNIEIILGKKINKGSWNNLFTIINNNKTDLKLVIRISNENAISESLNAELKGIKIQYKLCKLCPYIGNIIDYGMLKNSTINNKLQEYSIIEKYKCSLNDLLKNNIPFKNMNILVNFILLLLKTIHFIHINHYAHFDIKPSNIMFKKSFNNTINNLNFSIFDFGGCSKFTDYLSIKSDNQMASPAFSPPELLDRLFGKKYDIWALGIIFYLILIRKTYIKSNSKKIFMGKNKNNIKKKINFIIDSLNYNKICPNSINPIKYLGKFKEKNYLLLIKDFIKKCLTVDVNKRSTTKELLNHPLFTIF